MEEKTKVWIIVRKSDALLYIQKTFLSSKHGRNIAKVKQMILTNI